LTTKIPGLPGLPKDASPELKLYLQALGEAVEVRLGRRGDPADRGITLRELVDSGLAVSLKASPFDPNNSNAGNRGFTAPGTTPLDTAVPPAPTGLTTSAGFTSILLTWNTGNTQFSNFAFTEVFRSTTNVIGDAVLLGVSSGGTFTDQTVSADTYYYWVRHVSTSDIRGPFNAVAGTLAIVATEVSFLLDKLTGSVSASQLTTTLANQIDGSGSAYDLANLETFVGYDATYSGDNLATLIGNVEGAKDALETYTGYDSTYAGESLVSRLDTAETSITSLGSTVNDETNGVSATATALSGLATDVGGLKTAVFNTDGDVILASASNVTALETTVFQTDADGFVLDENNDKVSLIGTNITAISGLDTRVTANEGDITSVSSDVTALETQMFGVDGDGNQTVLLASASAVSDLSSSVTDLNNEMFETNADGFVLDENNNKVSILEAATNDITALETEVFAADGSSLLATASALSDLSSAVTTVNQELFEIDANGNLVTDAGGNYTSLLATASDVDALETVVFDENGNSKVATATGLSSLTTRVSTAEGQITTAESDIDTLETSVGSVSENVTGLQSQVFETDENGNLVTDDNDNYVPVLATATAVDNLSTSVGNINNTMFAKDSNGDFITDNDGNNSNPLLATTSSVTSVASDVTTLQSQVFETDANGNLVTDASGNYTPVLATATAVNDLSTAVTTVNEELFETDTNGNLVTDDDGNYTSLLATAASVTSVSQDLTTLDNTVTNETTGLSATASAVSALTTTVTSQGSTLASAVSNISTINSTVSGNSTSIQTNSTSIGGLEGQYTVKIDNNGAVAGFGLASTTTGDTADSAFSEFIINADRFAFVKTNDADGNVNTVSTPFVVQATQTTLNGETVPAGVYIDQGFIKNGAITNAKIGNAAIDNAKIFNLDAGKITTGELNANRISVDGSTMTRNSSGQLQVNEFAANRITSGILDADDVNVVNLDAGNITTGTLTADRIDVTDLLLPSAGGIVTGSSLGGFPTNTDTRRLAMAVGVGLGFYQGFIRVIGGSNHVKAMKFMFTNSNSATPSSSNIIYESPLTKNLDGHVDRFYSNSDSANMPIMFSNSIHDGTVYLWVKASGDSGTDTLTSVEARFIRFSTGSSTFAYGAWSSETYVYPTSPATYWSIGSSNALIWGGSPITPVSQGGAVAFDTLVRASDGYQYERLTFKTTFGFKTASSDIYSVRRRTWSST
jgi:hypothetical protein